MSEVITSNAGDVKASVENKPMSEQDFLSSRIAKLAPKAKPSEAKPKSPPEPEPSKSETSADANPKEGVPTEEKASKAVLSKDVDELTDEEIAELAEKGKSGLLKRVAELTAKRKLAEERLAQMQAAAQQASQTMPEAKVENNPYADIKSVEQLSTKATEVNEVIEWAEEVLDRADGVSSDGIVATVDGKEYTKSAIKETLRRARKARDKYLPAQFKEIHEEVNRSNLEQAFKQQARKELPWMEDDKNEVRQRFEAMTGDPRLKKLRTTVPELAPQIDYLIAHAANSMFGRRTIETEDKPLPRATTPLTPPSTPSSSAAAPERTESREERSVKDIESRFQKSGKPDDFVALRAAQISKRKLVK